ncbi:WW/Rsp5/WWP [Penicillium italicum]|uniref:WW/Rsp5/WWP n=1 Tax=Penicillium italicum TaxID=40296 RepID=A0A0A2LFS5_PENIT|nr:WW/Rsp5/WWP [Penicillium italicum]
MSALPEASVSAPKESTSSSPSASPSGLETEAKNDSDSQKDQAEKSAETQQTEEPETDASKSQPDKPEQDELISAPPLPDEAPPPLPTEAPPAEPEDDGWEPAWDANAGAYYFYNRFTGVSQWENPRVPEVPAAPGTENIHQSAAPKKEPVLGGYNPAIHGNYDPTAPYAQYHEEPEQPTTAVGFDPYAAYAATGTFNRFTGRWQAEAINPENHNDENKSRRQMNAFFDVDAAANSHDGRSLRAERSAKKLTKQELKQFKEKRRERKEERRRAWLRD